MAAMHVEPPPGAYGMGWESERIDGHRLINHDGGTVNSQASLFFDPDARVGVFVAANVMNALDAFSSPSGGSPLDGQTTRYVAKRVLSLVTNRAAPPPGPGHRRLTVLFDLTILILTGALAMAVTSLPARRRRLAARGIERWPGLLRHATLTALLTFTLPAVLLYFALDVPAWTVVVAFQPDLGYWLDAVAIVLLVIGASQLAFIGAVFRQPRAASARHAAS
jgi:hypothetical protein